MTRSVDDKDKTFGVEFNELLEWPYSINAVDASLDVKLIEGRGKQILFQGLRRGDLTAFAGSGLSVPYGHMSWQEWLSIQVDLVIKAAEAFRDWAKAQIAFHEVNRTGFAGGLVGCDRCGQLEVLKGYVVVGLRLGRRDVADRLQHAPVVEPIDPFEGLYSTASNDIHCSSRQMTPPSQGRLFFAP